MSDTAGHAVPVAAPGSGFISSRERMRSRGALWRLIGLICGVRTAAALIAILVIIILSATVYERDYGREATAAMVYHSWWFAGLFLALAVNIAGAALVRWPWKRTQAGFVVVHAGLLTLILGFFQAGNDRLDGQLIAPPGREVSAIELPIDHVSVALPGPSGETRASADFHALDDAGYPSLAHLVIGTFISAWAAPIDPGIHVLDQPRVLLSEARDGIDLSLTAVCDTARADSGFLPCPPDQEGAPAARLALFVHTPMMPLGQTQPMAAQWLSPATERVAAIGPLTATIGRTASALLVQDFLDPTPCGSAHGAVHIYLADGTRQVLPVPAQLPATVTLSPTLALEFRRYIPNPRVQNDTLDQDDTAPLDPFVMLRIGTGAEATRAWHDVVLSAHHLLPAPGGDCPELLYDHPLLHTGISNAGQAAWLQMLCGPDDRLHLRWFSRSKGYLGQATAVGGSWAGDLIGADATVVAAMRLHAEVTWLAHAVPGPEAVVMQSDQKDHATRWVRLSARRDGREASAWLPRGGAVSIDLGGGEEILTRYDLAQYSLKDHHGFALTLKQFDEGQDPGAEHAASYSSVVTIRALSDTERSEALARAVETESQARERIAASGAGRWLPPALVGLLRATPRPPPQVAGQEALITMNQPLTLGGATLYQTSFFPETDDNGQPTGRQVSVFTVAADPGRWCKYIGSGLLVGGILLMYLMRSRWRV